MDLGLEARACAVTGASRGIGLEVARRLCAEGASVLLIARTQDTVEAATAECALAGGAAANLTLDVTAPDAGERILGAAAERFGQLDVLVNNAGTAKRRSLDEVPEEDWQAAWELNVLAPLRAMRAAAPAMADHGWGRIVNVCSSAAKRPSGMTPEYSVTKAAELSLSRVFADAYAPRGVLVNAICPGPTKSELWMEAGGLLDQSAGLAGQDRDEALASVGAAARSAGLPRSPRSRTRSSSCARSALRTSPGRPGASTAARSR
jgi:3-oxoacyl-[acyl-carrier protein] reductase